MSYLFSSSSSFQKTSTHPVRFERTLGNRTSLAGKRLDHSATGAQCQFSLTYYLVCVVFKSFFGSHHFSWHCSFRTKFAGALLLLAAGIAQYPYMFCSSGCSIKCLQSLHNLATDGLGPLGPKKRWMSCIELQACI